MYLIFYDVDFSQPGAVVRPKGWAVRPLKRNTSWVNFGPNKNLTICENIFKKQNLHCYSLINASKVTFITFKVEQC